MADVTIFSAPKGFSDPHINIIQRNAIQSWLDLGSRVEVFLVGEEAGLGEAARQIGVGHLPDVERNQLGTPLVSSIFASARKASAGEILLYLNADIILLPECLDVIDAVKKSLNDFLLVGRRWDLDIRQPLDFDEGWSARLLERLTEEGRLRKASAMDYFIFPRHLFREIPDFAIGRAGWDNWMIYHGLHQPWPVIDITASNRVVHQNHDYAHLPQGAAHYDLEESRQNVALAGGIQTAYDLLDVRYRFQEGSHRRIPLSLSRILRKLERLVIPSREEGLRWQLTRGLRRLRRRISPEG